MSKGKTLLDPFCGSGTVLYEAKKHGINSIGADLNPLATVIASGKINIPTDRNEVTKETHAIIEEAKALNGNSIIISEAIKHFHINTYNQIARVATLYEKMSDYVKSSFLGAIALAARGCNHYKWTSSTVGKNIIPKRDIDFYDKFNKKTRKHYFPIMNNSSSQVLNVDARILSSFVSESSIDYVFSSPPYFDCLDYTAYYAKIVYSILGFDRLKIRNNLIQKFSTYEDDMRSVMDELYKVCKPGAKIIFVVGDKKVHGKPVNGGEFFNKISPFSKVSFLERSYSGTSSQIFDKLNNTNRKEQIVIWEK